MDDEYFDAAERHIARLEFGEPGETVAEAHWWNRNRKMA